MCMLSQKAHDKCTLLLLLLFNQSAIIIIPLMIYSLEQKAQEKVMGYDQPVQVRYYGDTRKETLLKYRKSPIKPTINPAIRGGKPRIPSMYDDQNEGKQLMLTGHLDGTTVA